MSRLERILRPQSIAVVGGGIWCDNIIRECRKIGFKGPIWPIHPTRDQVSGLPAFASVEELPDAPDAAFVGVNRHATVEVVGDLSRRGAGGVVCFASGFSEAAAELSDGEELQVKLLANAGEMPLIGPNCYGFVNTLDSVALWPDQHGAAKVESGVALITQSSNIGMNMSMQKRGLPLAYVVAAGNQAQTSMSEIGIGLLEDPRVTALGMHIEGIGDIRGFEALSRRAAELGKSIVALKVGASEQARAATVSHTASLAGSDAGAKAMLRRLGIGLVSSLEVWLETLKLLHVVGPLSSNRIASMSCSGGEASLIADSSVDTGLVFPPLDDVQSKDLRQALGPKVALANPLDYHTYIWGDEPALARCFSALMQGDLAIGCVILDFPRDDRCTSKEWLDVLTAAKTASLNGGVPMSLISTISDTMPEDVAIDAISRGIVPFCGLSEAVEAMSVAAWLGKKRLEPAPILLPGEARASVTISEAEAKGLLAKHGLQVPKSLRVVTPKEAADAAIKIGFPVVLKGEGLAHKTEAGAVKLNLTSAQDVEDAASQMLCESFLVETMIGAAVAELLIGVVRDPAHGFVLTLGAGGTLTEILKDSVSLLIPASEDEILKALSSLKIAPLLEGYRGADRADINGVVAAVGAIQSFVAENADQAEEVEINPLICTATGAIAADALIRMET